MAEKKKRLKQRNIGFIQGIAFAAAMVKAKDFDAYDLIKESGISISDFRKHADEVDIEQIAEILSVLSEENKV